MSSDLERFKHIEPRQADDDDAPDDPFAPPREKVAPIILDQRDADAVAKLRAEREARAAAALAAHQEKLAAEAPKDLVLDDDFERAIGWQWVTAQSPRNRVIALAGGLGVLGLLALAIGPVAWAPAPILIVVVAVSFLSKPA